MSSEFWAAILGAIVGAVIGGVIALIIQLVAIREGRRDRKEEKQGIEKALAHSLIFKAGRINSNNYHLHIHIEKSYASVPKKLHEEPCVFIQSLVSLFDKVYFSTQEMSFVLSLKNNELTNMMMSLSETHNGLIDAFHVYNNMRESFQKDLPAEMNGNIGTLTFTKEEAKLVRPKMIIMNGLLLQIRERAEKDFEQSTKASKMLIEELNDKPNLDLKYEYKEKFLTELNELKKKNNT